MHGPAASALSVILFGLAALITLGAGAEWAKVARRVDRGSASLSSIGTAAGITAAAFLFLGLALAWSALVSLP